MRSSYLNNQILNHILFNQVACYTCPKTPGLKGHIQATLRSRDTRMCNYVYYLNQISAVVLRDGLLTLGSCKQHVQRF